MDKPRILLSCIGEGINYVRAVEQAGATAVARYKPKYSDEFDALILCGGGDVDPRYYNRENTASTNIDILRDEAELELIAQFAQKGKRILGICRGLQIINVFFGGTLCQSIVSTTAHAGKNDVLHTVTAEKDSILYSLYGREFISNSNHHQAIGELGAGLRITATCESVIEAVEHVKFSISAVQFHPERMLTVHTADGAKIFSDFIEKTKQIL